MHKTDIHQDQAAGLRRVHQPGPVKVIAVTSGKGGVGKTNVSANLAVSLASKGRSVMLMDADLGLANVDVLLGLQPGKNLSHVLDGECSLDDIVLEGPFGLAIVPAASGIRQMTGLNGLQHAELVRVFSELTRDVDTLLIDTAAGISESVVSFSRAAHELVVVVCDEPASITDAYALIKMLSRDYGVTRFNVVANMTRSPTEGAELFAKLVKVTDRFLTVVLSFLGSIPYDEALRRAVQQQCAVVDGYPGSRSAMAFKKMAIQADRWVTPHEARGHVEFFVERLVGAQPDSSPDTYAGAA